MPQPFAQIIHRALASGPDQRFPSTREMARQIGTVLKKVQLRKDLHTILAKTVVDARSAMGIEARHDPSAATPIAELVPDQTARLDQVKPDEKPKETGLRALRHYLPFFGRKRG